MLAHIFEGRLAALVCFLAILTGGGVPAFAQPSDTLLQMICWQNEGEKLQGSVDLLADFQEANPGLRVNLTYDRWPQAHARLKYWTGSLRNYAPDLTVMHDTWLPQFATSLVPLDDLLTERDLQGMQPALLDRCRANGKLLGVPWLCEARVLYYRTDLFEAAKLPAPQTLDDLRAAAKALTTPERYGLGLPAQPGGGGVDAYLGLLWAFGGEALRNGKPALKSDQATQALQYWLDLQREGVAEPEALAWNSSELDEAFATDKLAMVFSGPALGKYLRQQQPKLKFATAPLPGAKSQPGQVSADVLVLLGGTKNSEAAVRFLRYMLSANAQRALWLMGGLPARKEHLEQARQDPAQHAFVERLPEAKGLPLQQTERFGSMVERSLWLALSGRAGAAEALRQALQEDEEPGLAGG